MVYSGRVCTDRFYQYLYIGKSNKHDKVCRCLNVDVSDEEQESKVYTSLLRSPEHTFNCQAYFEHDGSTL